VHEFVPRRRLVRRLIASRRAPLVVLAAPTGYGKTCLLSEWSEVDERAFAWVTLEASDNDVGPMAARIVQAVAAADSAGAAAASPVSEIRFRDAGVGIPGLVRLLERAPPLVLVLDDAHVLHSLDALDALRVLAQHLPRGSQLALGSRVQPPLPLGRLRARHQLVELHAPDLTMDESEAAMLLRTAGLSLDPDHVATLVRRTEGWPAALYLSALSLRDEPDCAAQVERFAGDDGILSDYLREELIGGISGDAATFLRRTSVLDQLSGSLCDAVLERTDSAVLLQDLARRHLLLAPLDRTDEWYRCHGLLREMLLREMRRQDPDGACELHRRASCWHSAHGDPDRAVAHAVRGDDARRAGALLWTHLPRYMDRGRDDIVEGWLGTFTEAEVADDPALSLFMAHRHLSSGDLAQAEYWGGAAAAVLARSEQAPDADSLHAGVLLIEAVVARHGMVAMAEAATRAFELESEHSQWRAVCRLYQGIASHLTGDSLGARELLDDGVHRSAHMPSVESLCHTQLAIIALGEHDWELAEERSGRATALIERHNLEQTPSAALVFAVAALVRAQLGRADGAKELVRQATRLLRTSDHYAPWYAEETRIMLARAAARLTDMRRARTLLAEASRAARRVPDAPVLNGLLDEALGELDSGAAAALEGSSLLTLAELRILRFLPTHLSFREIGDRLHVSTNTVKSQAHAVYRKLDASSRSEAVARASRVGLIWSATSNDV
jgi:LuxR family maltose regulon positive regulatory protein